MAITAVNSVLFRNNIGFTGNKNKGNKQPEAVRSSSSLSKAVPLATLLAMSPLVTTKSSAANKIDLDKNKIELVEAPQVKQTLPTDGKVVAQKRILSEEDEDGISSEVFVKDVGTKAMPLHAIYVKVSDLDDRLADREGLEGNVIAVVNLHYNVKGDDGFKGMELGVKQVIVQDKNDENMFWGVSSKPLREYIESVINNPKYTPLPKITDITREIRPTYSTGLQNVATDPSWKQKVAGKSVKPGNQINSAIVEGASGMWVVGAFSKDDNPDNYEAIVIIKDNVQYKVDELRTITGNLENYSLIDTISYNQINVTDADGNKHVILDEELFNILGTLPNDPNFNNAFKTKTTTENHLILPNGTISKLNY